MYLVDACTIIVVKDPNRAKPRWILDVFDERPELLFVSATTVWEIEIKAARRPSVLTAFWEPRHANLVHHLTASRIEVVPFTGELAVDAARLPPHHKDPFDRALIATARRLQLPIISFDRRLARYEGIDLRWD